MTLNYTIKFLDYWHLSSGLSAGSKLDSTVVKDADTGLPYVPGKTIKGLAREMAELLEDTTFIKECFGEKKTDMGKSYFSNATLDKKTESDIVENNLQEHLYDVLSSTKIGRDKNEKESEGIAVDNSLRQIEVVVPLTLHGKIEDVSQEYSQMMQTSLIMIKRMGLNRNRGLGRCQIAMEVSV